MRRHAGTASKYLATQTVLSCIAFGGVWAAEATDPRAPIGPAAMLFGLVLGYWWRDALGEWRGQQALAKMRREHARAQEQGIAALKQRAQDGIIPADARPAFLGGVPAEHRAPFPGGKPADTQQEAKTDGT